MTQLDNDEALTILHYIVKIFYVSNQLMLCPFLRENNSLAPWIQMFKILLDMQLPENLESPTEDIDEIVSRDKNIRWKLKAQAARTTFRLFSKFAQTKYVEND